jgi:hypothetical protein
VSAVLKLLILVPGSKLPTGRAKGIYQGYILDNGEYPGPPGMGLCKADRFNKINTVHLDFQVMWWSSLPCHFDMRILGPLYNNV